MKSETKNNVKRIEYLDNVQYRMNEEGFDYCFDGYSNWSEIKDQKFHDLRQAYLKSKSKLEEYINNNI